MQFTLYSNLNSQNIKVSRKERSNTGGQKDRIDRFPKILGNKIHKIAVKVQIKCKEWKYPTYLIWRRNVDEYTMNKCKHNCKQYTVVQKFKGNSNEKV